MQKDVIYCLAELNGDPFYVGRTINKIRREKEHRRSAPTGTEMKYQTIRQIWARGSDFELIELDANPKERYERYYHYILGLEFELTNQKMGDKQAIENSMMKKMKTEGKSFNNPELFLTELDREVAEEKARQQAAKTQNRIRNRAFEEPLYSFEKPTKFVSPWMKERMKKVDEDIATQAAWEKEYYDPDSI